MYVSVPGLANLRVGETPRTCNAEPNGYLELFNLTRQYNRAHEDAIPILNALADVGPAPVDAPRWSAEQDGWAVDASAIVGETEIQFSVEVTPPEKPAFVMLEGYANREVNAGSWIARASDGQAFLEITWQANDPGMNTTYELVGAHRQVQLQAANTSSAEFLASANEEATSAWDTLTGYFERPGADRLCWERTGDEFCPTACTQ
jgi:hypothetical protein